LKQQSWEEEPAFLTSCRGPGPFTKAIDATVGGRSLGSSWQTLTVASIAKRTTGLGMQWVGNFNHGVSP